MNENEKIDFLEELFGKDISNHTIDDLNDVERELIGRVEQQFAVAICDRKLISAPSTTDISENGYIPVPPAVCSRGSSKSP